ncbi:MAG: (Fe-S)-binding protein [Deinococcales bacterium]|nr:(Fe-S)-binding protein [Deinococcales bacterium]
MLSIPEKVLFLLFAAAMTYYAYLGFAKVWRAVARGERGTTVPRLNGLARRLTDGVLRTMSQRTVFRARPVASFFHSFIFYGFVLYLAVNVVDAMVGLLPRAWLQALDFGVVGSVYRLVADVLTVLILVGVVYFLVRRFLVKPRTMEWGPRTHMHEQVREGSVKRDSLVVGGFILLHVGSRLLAESFLLAGTGHTDAWQPFSSAIASAIGFGDGRMLGWHVFWWLALGLILAFLPYFPRSKHLHLFAAPVNFALERRTPELAPVPTGVLEPVDLEDEDAEQFGAARLEHLRFPQILDAYACIQCNRCANVCPAHQTGKALSPAALEVNKRYELNTIVDSFAAGEDSPRPLVEFALPPEAVWACTTCGACMEVCPVGCEQMIDIVDMRRDLVMMQGEFPAELQTAFRGMERTGNPWGLAAEKRLEWAEGLEVPTVEENPGFEVLFFVGCAGAYDPAAQKTTRAMARILDHAKVDYAVLGKGERCTGDPARRAGNEYLYYQLATENVETLNAVLLEEKLDATKRKVVLTTCPHCFNALANDYPQLGGDYTVMHHTQLIEQLIGEGRLPPFDLDKTVTYHDPCYLGRHNGVYDAPRNALTSGSATLVEMPRNRNDSFCCGAGGAQFWKEEEPGDMRVSENRYQEAVATGAEVIATGCPFCKVMLASSDSAEQEGAPEVLDVAQLVAMKLDGIQALIDHHQATSTGAGAALD